MEKLNEFLKQQKILNPFSPDLVVNKRNLWLKRIDDLFNHIVNDLIKDSIIKSLIDVQYLSIVINEPGIGEYTTKKLLLLMGKYVVSLTPIGTIIVGAEGRIDFLGPYGKASLLIIPQQTKDEQDSFSIWKFFDNELSKIHYYLPFDKDSFERIILSLMGEFYDKSY